MSETFPQSFGKYILVRPLAMGRMGGVHLALAGEIGGLEKLCVIKKVTASADREAAVRRFLEEAKITVKLNHSNLVQVFDVGAVNGEHYLAMEYVEGQNLCEMLDRCVETRDALPPAAALYIAIQICRSLQYAHSYGDLNLVHRDLCPANVLISYFGEVKVAGFGMTYAMERAQNPNTIYGRPSYLAPEQLDPTNTPDHRTDIYTVGIMLWEMLVGEPMRPEVSSSEEALAVIRRTRVTPPTTRNGRLPAQLDPLVVKTLQPRPEHRYSSAEALRKGLAKTLAQIDPTFESSQLADIMKKLYRRQIEASRGERKRLLAEDYQHLRRAKRLTGPPSGQGPIGEVDLSGQPIGDRYQAIGLIGEGGMGAVYEAEHTEIGRRVAIKVLHAAYSRDAEAVTRFREEARAATKIGHPNIVEVTDSGVTHDGRFFFVMERLSGIDLANVMATQRMLPIDSSIDITLQICEGLHAAHEAGIIHRDLKPENVFLSTREGRENFVTLLDFGIAKNLDLAKEGEARLTTPGIAIGTPEYMAPEQAAGEEIDRRIDVYATSTMLYEMLTGCLPHEAQNLMQLINKKASEQPIPPSQYRPELAGALEEAILGGLYAARDKRWATMREFAAALERYRQHGGAEDPTLPVTAMMGRSFVDVSSGDILPAQTAELSLGTETVRADPTLPVLPTHTPDKSASAQSRMRLVWGVLGGAVAVGLLAGLFIWWTSSSSDPVVKPSPDVGAPPVDAVVVKPPDVGTKPAKPEMTPEEMDRLLEWAKRAADGRRFTRPRGDNVQELLRRVTHAFGSDHKRVVEFRKWLVRQLKARARWSRRRKQYASEESIYRSWLALLPDDKQASRRYSGMLVRRGQREMSRRRFKKATKDAIEAAKLAPNSPSPQVLLGDLAIRRRRASQAIKHYREALKKKTTRRHRRLIKRKLARARRRAR